MSRTRRPGSIGPGGRFQSDWVAELVGIRIQEGSLAGKTVNIKWYGKQEGALDVSPDPGPDFYLVLTGPRAPAASSRLAVRPWVIDRVYLFEHCSLVAALRERGVHIGVATSMQNAFWEAAEIYPMARNPLLPLSHEQALLLAALSSERESAGARGGG